MGMTATKYAIEVSRKLLGDESIYDPLVLGSLHDIDYKFSRQLDWTGRGIGENVNFNFDIINSGKWNLIFNCCCEHMYPMSEVTLPGVYVMQSTDRYSDAHINPTYNMKSHLDNLQLDEIYYTSERQFNGATYYTAIGEKW